MKFSPPNEFLNPDEELIQEGPANRANNLVSLHILKSKQVKNKKESKSVFPNKNLRKCNQNSA